MKRLKNIILCLYAFSYFCPAQENYRPNGSITGTIFFNYHYEFSQQVNQKSTFEIERVYLGCNYNFSKNISSLIIFDIGYDSIAYTAFVKNAELNWIISDKLVLSAGVIGLKQFDSQEKFWGYRYIFKSFDDEYELGSSADLGINIELPLNEKFSVNLILLNGDGYKSFQDLNSIFRYGGNIILNPFEKLTAKIYYDIMPGKDFTQPKDTSVFSNISAFVGYENQNKFRIGLEYNYLLNGKDYKTFADGYNYGGISFYGTYIYNPFIEVFARYDNMVSKNFSGSKQVLDISKSGSMLLGGIQYQPINGVMLGLNYRLKMYREPNFNNRSELFLNLGFHF